MAGFLAEVGDIGRFNSPKQIQKPAGPALKEDSSGKRKGQSFINRRGQRRLRKLLFQVVLPMIQNNADFRDIYEYFTTRQKNPLKGKQAIAATGCKSIRVFNVILKKGVTYDAEKLSKDIVRPAAWITQLLLNGMRPPVNGVGKQECRNDKHRAGSRKEIHLGAEIPKSSIGDTNSGQAERRN